MPTIYPELEGFIPFPGVFVPYDMQTASFRIKLR